MPDRPAVTDDPYHPHRASVDRDHFQRLADSAHLVANPFRLQMHRYGPADEARCVEAWDEARARLAGRS